MTTYVQETEWFVIELPNECKGTRLQITYPFYERWRKAEKEFLDCQEELRKLINAIGEVAGPMSPSKITHELNPE